MRRMSKLKGVFAALITVGMGLSVQAQGSYGEDDGGAARINNAGKTRALSQRIPAVTCVLVYSNDPETMRPYLATAIGKFDKIITALRDGNPDMKIMGAEKKRRILQQLDALSTMWEPFRAAAKNVEAGEKIEESMAFIAENNMALLTQAKLLVAEVAAEYANPVETTKAEEQLINFSGRQRMLTQKIAKESCGVVTGNDAFGHIDDFNKTVSLYELTLQALRDGMPAVGVSPPPTEKIKGNLEKALGDWQEIKDILSKVTGKDSVDSDTIKHLFDLLETKLQTMNKITGLYAEYAKTH